MLDPDLTNVLKRRIVASLIDVGIAAIVTLGVWRSQLIAFPISSRDMITDLPIWSAEQQARRDAIAESLNTSFTWGNSEYAIDQTGIVLTALCAIVMLFLLFVLLPANTGWSPGKKLLGLGVVDDEGNNPSIPAYLIRSAVGIVDALPVVIPGLAGWVLARTDDFHRRLGDRVAGTYVIDSNVGARFIDPGVYERRNELRRAATATHDPAGDDEMVQIGDRLGGSQSGLHRDDLDPADAADAAGAYAPDGTIGELGSVGREMGASMLDELPAPAADDPAELIPLPSIDDGLDTLPPLPTPGAHGAIEHGMDTDHLDSTRVDSAALEASQPEAARPEAAQLESVQPETETSERGRSEISDMDPSHGSGTVPTSAPAPSHRSPSDAHNLDDFASPSAPSGEPAAATEAASELDVGANSGVAHTSAPKPTHRGASRSEPEWEQPTPEPAPVWEPNGSSASFEPVADSDSDSDHADHADLADASSFAPRDTAEAPLPDSSLTDWSMDSSSTADSPTADSSTTDSSQADSPSQASDSGSNGPSDAPGEGLVWNDQWQAWLFWDAEHEHWLRHDIDRDRWVPIS